MTLVVDSLDKRLGSFELSSFSLTVNRGEYFVLLGPSGVGKTVLMELIAGLLRPDRGHISWMGRDVTNAPPERRNFAIVYQDYSLFPHLTVRSNLAYGLWARRQARDQTADRLDEVARQVGIRELLARTPATLSGGEQQRVALARAMVVGPELLLLDEPLSAVDLQFRRVLRKLLKQLHRESRTTFLHVTHDVEEAVLLGERIGVMLDGSLRQLGTPIELFQHPTDPDVAEFLGMRNILAVDPLGDGQCSAQGVPIHVSRREERYSYIWIRPEEILLSAERFDSSARNQLACEVLDWEMRDVLVTVRLRSKDLTFSALITFGSFQELNPQPGSRIYATFKSTAIHCF
jgi:molybdate/tungstate transport system ATP-binding protein